MKKQILIQTQTGIKSALIRHRRQPINQRWHRIVCQMIQELRHRIDSLPARWAPGHDNAFSALRDRWKYVNEVDLRRKNQLTTMLFHNRPRILIFSQSRKLRMPQMI
jgi:hypothetical protein